jgi:hypothetical protein
MQLADGLFIASFYEFPYYSSFGRMTLAFGAINILRNAII